MIIAFFMLIFGGFLVTPQTRDLVQWISDPNLKNLRPWNHGNLFGKWMLKMKKILEGPGKKVTNLQQIIARNL